MNFTELGLIPELLRALRETGYETPTPVQERTIPLVLQHHDVIGCAQTGTGKTAAFSLPLLQLLHAKPIPGGPKRPVRALILTPTRELAIQIGESITDYGKYLPIKHTVIFGGVGQRPQEQALARGIDILVATPGRLLDLIQQGFLSLRQLEFFILDEADRMLDMGFIHDIKKVIAMLPPRRQSLFFSATMPAAILQLSGSILRDPRHVAVTPDQPTVEKIDQSLYFVDKGNKKHLLLYVLTTEATESVLVFLRTKHGANRVVKELLAAGITAEAIHGNKSQTARQNALANFKSKKTRVLVATDIAARGLDIDQLPHVINYEIPNEPETYVHRIGRTGRAGAAGRAISFCDADEKNYLRDIQRLISQQIPVIEEHPHPMQRAASDPQAPHRQQEGRPARQFFPRRQNGPRRG